MCNCAVIARVSGCERAQMVRAEIRIKMITLLFDVDDLMLTEHVQLYSWHLPNFMKKRT